jgi:hypothetical protein
MGLEEWHLPASKKVELSFVVVGATDGMTDFCQTCGSRQAYVASTND